MSHHASSKPPHVRTYIHLLREARGGQDGDADSDGVADAVDGDDDSDGDSDGAEGDDDGAEDGEDGEDGAEDGEDEEAPVAG